MPLVLKDILSLPAQWQKNQTHPRNQIRLKNKSWGGAVFHCCVNVKVSGFGFLLRKPLPIHFLAASLFRDILKSIWMWSLTAKLIYTHHQDSFLDRLYKYWDWCMRERYVWVWGPRGDMKLLNDRSFFSVLKSKDTVIGLNTKERDDTKGDADTEFTEMNFKNVTNKRTCAGFVLCIFWKWPWCTAMYTETEC